MALFLFHSYLYYNYILCHFGYLLYYKFFNHGL
nr:MAG TPA: hypothetical protein [Bacteriophage sp.]